MDIQANMRLVDKGSVVAVGEVLIDGLFAIRPVKVLGLDAERKDWKVYLPQKKQADGKWTPVLEVDKKVFEKIKIAVMDSLKEVMGVPDLYKEDVQVDIRPYADKAGTGFLGYADVTYEGIKIKDIQMFRNGADFRVNLPGMTVNNEKAYLVQPTSVFVKNNITKLVQAAYDEKIQSRKSAPDREHTDRQTAPEPTYAARR